MASPMKQKLQNNMKALVAVVLLLVLLVSAIWYNVAKSKNVPKAQSGVLNLADWDFDDKGMMMLSGKWAFFWDKLSAEAGITDPSAFVEVPDVWNNYEINGEKLPAFGYATYSLLVKGVRDESISLRILPCSTAYELYVDGKMLATNGNVSVNSAEAAPEYKPQCISIEPRNGQFTLTLLVSNYDYARGGVWYPLLIGTPNQIENINRIINYIDLILIGCFLAISLFCLFIYFFAKRNQSIIYFALLAVTTALRTSIYGSYLLSSTGIEFRLLVVIEYLTLIWTPALIALFLLSLGKNDRYSKLRLKINILSCILTSLVIVTPVYIFTKFTTLIELFGIGVALYSLFCFAKSENQSKTVVGIGVVVLMSFGIHDVLYQLCVIRAVMELSPIGFFVLLNTWGVALVQDYTKLNEDARISKEKAKSAEIAFLQAQIKPHFLYNALNVIAALCRIDGVYAEELTIDLSKYLHYTFEFKNLSKYISFTSELEFIETYVKIEKARFVNEFEVVYDLCDTSRLSVPPLSIQPLVENAIRHGIRKKEQFGTVKLKVYEENGCFKIEVEDNGAGIDPETLERLRHGIRNDDEGVGLSNVKRRIEYIYKTELEIISEIGVGTKIIITIPR